MAWEDRVVPVQDPLTPQRVAREDGPVDSGSRARVLIVDDDENNLLALSTLLEDSAQVVTASSGDAALRKLLEGDFAVILLDVFMPEMDGYETADLIRRRQRSQRIPIIFLSAVNKEASHLVRGYAMGAVDYVFKPVDPMILCSKVAVFVDLYEKTQEIERKAAYEQQLLDTALRANAERLRVEQELRIAEQRQGAIIQSLPIIFYLAPLDHGGRQLVGGDFEALTGFEPEILELEATWHSRVHPLDQERVINLLATRPDPTGMAIEYRWQCADGRYKQFLDQAVLLRDDKGDPTGFAGSLLDITEQKELELELVQARKMDAIGKLTGGIAHDFNNLLGAVLGGLGLIQRRVTLTDDQRKIVGMTQHAAEQGAELVRRLLAFSRRQQLEPKPVDIKKLASRVDELLSHTLGGLVALEWQIADDVWRPMADESQLELAVMNLVINARDAMPAGGTILVKSENRSIRNLGDDSGMEGYVVLTVLDHGAGIPPDVLQQVFEPFFTTKEVGKGTGLGLSMVYGFAQQSGGKLEISSQVGVGTEVRLSLPRVSETTESTVTHDEATTASPAPHRCLRIALLDDHEAMRATTAALLTDLGHKVTEFSRGSDIVAYVANLANPVDLIVSDYAMPQMSGIEVIARAQSARPGLRAVLITGYAEAPSLTSTGEVPVIQKPFSSEQMALAVNRLFEVLPERGIGLRIVNR